LHGAALNDDPAEVQRLIAAGADVNARDAAEFAPLHYAAQEWAERAARQLLAAGADVDVLNGPGNTPLFVAVFNSRGRGELITLLLRSGADPTRTNNAGQSALGLAQLIGNYHIERFFTESADD
jgi:ankyrin repeat protein